MALKTLLFNALLLVVDLAVAAAAAAGMAFLVSPGLPWLLVFVLMLGAYLAFTAYAVAYGTPVLLERLKARPLDLALHPVVGRALQECGADPAARRPEMLRTAGASVNALSLGWEGKGCLVLTDGALEELGGAEVRALVARELARLRRGDAAVWRAYARFTLSPTLFARLTGRRGYGTTNPALNRAFFLFNLALLSLFWAGALLTGEDSGNWRALLIAGMPSCMLVMTLLTNLLASVPLYGLLRSLDWRKRELAADAAAAALPGGGEALASIFARAGDPRLGAGTSAFERSAWVGPVRLRKAYFINYEALYQVGGWNPQPSLNERREAAARLRNPGSCR